MVVPSKETKSAQEKEVKKETAPTKEKKEATTSKKAKPVEQAKISPQPPAAVTQPSAEKKTEITKAVSRKPLDDASRLRIFQVLQKYRQSNYKETFAEFENLWNEYNDANLKRTFVECLVGAATKLTEQKNYLDAFIYARRAYELNPNDTAAERLYKNLKERPEIQGVVTPQEK